MEVREPSAKYLANPAYKHTEIGLIPQDWEVIRLGDLAIVRDGTHQTPKYVAFGVPFFSVEQVTSGNFEDTKFISEKEHQHLTRFFKIEKGDILMTRIGSIGDCKLIDWDVDASFYVSLALLKVQRALPAYIAQYANSAAFRAEVEVHSLQSAIPKKINLGPISDIKVAVPPFPEQQAIAEALNDADALIEALEQLLVKKRQIKQGAMQELLTGQKRLPGFAENWVSTSLGTVGEFLKGSGITRNEAESGTLPCVRYGEIYTSHNVYIRAFYSSISAEVAANATRLKQGDLLFAGSGETKEEIGKCIAFLDDMEAYAGGDIVILRPRGFDSLFLGYVLNSAEVNRQKASRGQGDAVVHISAAALGKIMIRVPEVKEQTAIATLLFDMDAEIAALEAKLAKACNLKQGMMQELLTGKIRLV